MKTFFSKLLKHFSVLVFGLSSVFCMNSMDLEEVKSISDSSKTEYHTANSKSWDNNESFDFSDSKCFSMSSCDISDFSEEDYLKGNSNSVDIDVSGESAPGDGSETIVKVELDDIASNEDGGNVIDDDQNIEFEKEINDNSNAIELEQAKTSCFVISFLENYKLVLGVGFIGAVVTYYCFQYFKG